MARQKKEEAPTGAPAWMATFSDLMNLLLCFFVLLFSMSTVDEEKFQALIASLQSQYSILTGGGHSVGEGRMISAGINQMQKYDVYFNNKATTSGEGKSDAEKKDILHTLAENDGENHNPEEGYANEAGNSKGVESAEETLQITQAAAEEVMEAAQMSESERMAERAEKLLQKYGIQDMVDVQFNGQHVTMTLNGAVLFASGSSELMRGAKPLMKKIGKILQKFPKRTIEVEGHTDNVPIHNGRYEDNNVLSMYRALSVADFIRNNAKVDPAYIKSSGRGDYVPVADNASAQGRAQNRRVEIKIYNSYNSQDL